jgi:hypothetical protein
LGQYYFIICNDWQRISNISGLPELRRQDSAKEPVELAGSFFARGRGILSVLTGIAIDISF